jgi:hypothetical protein
LIEFKILNVASRKFTSLGIWVHPVTRNQAWVLIFHAWIVCSKRTYNKWIETYMRRLKNIIKINKTKTKMEKSQYS